MEDHRRCTFCPTPVHLSLMTCSGNIRTASPRLVEREVSPPAGPPIFRRTTAVDPETLPRADGEAAARLREANCLACVVRRNMSREEILVEPLAIAPSALTPQFARRLSQSRHRRFGGHHHCRKPIVGDLQASVDEDYHCHRGRFLASIQIRHEFFSANVSFPEAIERFVLHWREPVPADLAPGAVLGTGKRGS